MHVTKPAATRTRWGGPGHSGLQDQSPPHGTSLSATDATNRGAHRSGGSQRREKGSSPEGRHEGGQVGLLCRGSLEEA